MSVVRNPQALTYPLEHHAKGVKDIVYMLGTEILLRLTPLGWEVRQSGTGPNSFLIQKNNDKFYFRYTRTRKFGPIDGIRVLDSYHRGKVVTVLTTRLSVIKWVAEVENRG